MVRYQHSLLRLLVALFGLTMLSGCSSHEFKGTVIEQASPAPDFTLTDHNEQPFRLSEQRGKVVLMFFGFTTCPDICPTTLSDMNALERALGDDAEQVDVVFVTVDPERDTADRLKRYVTNYNPSFIGVYGTQAELDPVIKSYGVVANKRELPDSALKYTMDHSAFVYLIDRSGKWQQVFSFGMDV
ncbi:MAG: SCO family protein, partial [Blastochloris sp.]|nr:SCO family protein [Blastochloris sp.]